MKKRVLGTFLFFLGFLTNPLTNTITIGAEPVAIEQVEEYTQTAEEEPQQERVFIVCYDPAIEPLYDAREFTYDEAQMLMRIAQAEAGNQGVEGMKLVMMVVLNRVASDHFPDTIEGVIFQDNQFQPVSDGRYYEVEISTEAHLALADIETGKPIDTSIIGFEVSTNKSLEKYFDYAYTYGDHDFYTEKGEKE